ncbi:DNA-binding protein, partial [Pseudomonas aeruginosa]|uniref:DNA-binding protein n=2 Tax=Pseudomonas TaxID=286 RepID=UPI003D2A5D80
GGLMSEHEGNDQVADVRARVFREADRLYEELGRERFPQVEAVRRAARADMNTVTRVMKEWRHLQTAKPEPVHLELPPELHREALTLGSALWSAATEMANASLRKAEADWDQERADAESTRIELSQLYEEQQGDLERLREDKQALQQAFEEQVLVIDGLRQSLAQQTSRAESAEARTEEITQRVEDLKGELQRARDEATGLRNELSAARQSHQVELEQVKAVAAEAIDRAKAELAEAKGRAEAQLEGIAARAEDLQQRLDAAQKEVFRLQAADELAQEQRKRAAAEANTQAQRFTKVQAERDEARKQAQDAGLRAARFEGELESLRESNAQLLAHVGASTAKSPAKGRNKSNKPEGQ